MSDSQAQATQEIVANHNPLVNNKETTFTFRKVKDETSGVETKRNPITATLPFLSVEGIIDVIQRGGAELDLLLSAAESVVSDYAKQLINDDPNITTENFPIDKISFAQIANLPPSERRGRGINAEVWKAWAESFVQSMPELTGKTVDQVKRQAQIMLQKFQPLKTHERKMELLPKFIEMLGVYANSVPGADEYSNVIEFLVKKAEEFMQTEQQADLAENLGFE